MNMHGPMQSFAHYRLCDLSRVLFTLRYVKRKDIRLLLTHLLKFLSRFVNSFMYDTKERNFALTVRLVTPRSIRLLPEATPVTTEREEKASSISGTANCN